MKNTYKTISVVGLFILFALALYILYTKENKKIAFVKNTDLYNEFGLKKELENKLTKVKNQRKAILDSLYIPLQLLSTQLESSKNKDQKLIMNFQLQKKNYLLKQQEFDEDNKRLADDYSQQIWKQINQYVADYGKENGYFLILGATGDGSLMYAKEEVDLTKELKEYINAKYSGENRKK